MTSEKPCSPMKCSEYIHDRKTNYYSRPTAYCSRTRSYTVIYTGSLMTGLHMPGFAVLRAKKLKTKSQISGSARHTFRDIVPPNSDLMRSGHNQYSRIQAAENLLSPCQPDCP
jgi:hypothetical protein